MGGKHRVRVDAADHDLQPLATVTPVGVFLPALEELFLYGVTWKVTSDGLVVQRYAIHYTPFSPVCKSSVTRSVPSAQFNPGLCGGVAPHEFFVRSAQDVTRDADPSA